MGYTEDELKALLISDLGLSGSPSDYPLYDLERMAFFSGFSTPKGLTKHPVFNTARYYHSGQSLRDKLASNQSGVLLLLGDSTANATDEWFYLALDTWRNDYPSINFTHEVWNDTNKNYDAATILQAGSGGPVPTPVLTDTFTRNAANIGGTNADTGQTWQGTATGSVDGTKFTCSGTTDAYITHNVDPLGANGILVELDIIKYMGSVGGTRFFPLFLDSNNHIFVEVFANSSGTVTLNTFKRVNSTATNLGQSATLTTTSLTTQNANIHLTVTIKNGKITVTGKFNSETVSQSNLVNEANSWNVYSLAAQSFHIQDLQTAGSKPSIDNLNIGVNGADPKSCRCINGSMPGASTDYLYTYLDLMAPVTPDLTIINSSHNHLGQSVETYLDKLDSLIAALLKKYPNTGIALSSQNPEFNPFSTQANRDLHAARLAALPSYCASNGYGYIPASEKFYALSDYGKTSMVGPDGEHPTSGGGSNLWRDAAISYFKANNYRVY